MEFLNFTDKVMKACTFRKDDKCKLSIPLSLCDRCLAYHPKEKNLDAMRERLHLDDDD